MINCYQTFIKVKTFFFRFRTEPFQEGKGRKGKEREGKGRKGKEREGETFLPSSSFFSFPFT